MGEADEGQLARLKGGLVWWGSPKRAMALLVLTVLLAFALRLYRLGYQSVWYDEGVSIHLATKDLSDLTRHTAGDIHPPLYYYLLHFWILMLGPSEFSAAFLSLVFGMLIIALSYRLARDLYGRHIGLLTAFLIAISPFNLWYSQEIRMYSLGACLGLISLYCLMRLTGMVRRTSLETPERVGIASSRDGRSWKLWMGYVLSATAGLYSLYYFVFLLLLENLFVFGWWVFNKLGKREGPLSLARWLLAQGAVLLLYLPWLPVALRQALDPPVPPWREFTGLGTVVTDSWAALALGQSVDPQSVLIWPLLSFLFAIYLLGLLSPTADRQGRMTTVLFCGYTFVPLLAIHALSLRTPLFHVRYLYTYSTPFYLLLALGFVRLVRISRVALPVSLALLTVASGYSIYNFHFAPQYAADDHRGAVGYLEERIAPGDAVLIDAGYAYPPFLYYFEGEIAWQGRLVNYEPVYEELDGVVVLQTGVIGGDEGLGWGDPNSDFYATSQEETAPALEGVFARHPRVWVYRIYDTVTDPQGFIRDWLDEHGRMIGDVQLAGPSYMRVQCYATIPEPAYQGEITYHPLDVRLDGRVGLLGYDGPPGVRSGADLRLTLYWQAWEELEADYNVLLRLTTSDGAEFARLDEPLSPPTTEWQVGQIISQTVSLHLPAGTPPLPFYSLILEMYDPATRQTLATAPGGWGMATIRVSRPLVPPRPPQMTHEPWANFGNIVQLVGYEMEPLEAEAGKEVHLELLWRAWDPPLPLMQTVVQLRDEEGQVQAREEGNYLGRGHSTVLWEGEELVRDLYDFQIPEGISPGIYELALTLQRIGTMQDFAETEGREPVPFWSSLGEREESFILGVVEVAGP
ncbi:MAG: glycosyltransferase family 39 protein [Anaerolineae bacterium]